MVTQFLSTDSRFDYARYQRIFLTFNLTMKYRFPIDNTWMSFIEAFKLFCKYKRIFYSHRDHKITILLYT